MPYKFSKRESRLTLCRRLRCIRYKIFPQGKAVIEGPVLFIKSGKLADDPAIDECAEDRAPFYAHKMQGPKARKLIATPRRQLTQSYPVLKRLISTLKWADTSFTNSS